MTIGLSLVKSIIQENIPQLSIASENISSDKLMGDEAIAFDFINNHFIHHGRYPLIQTVEVETGLSPGILASAVEEPFSFWAEEVNQRWKHRKLESLRQNLETNLNAQNIEGAMEYIQEIQSELLKDRFSVVIKDIKDLHSEVMQKHNAVQQMSTIPGVPFGFPFIDNVSGGVQSGDLVVVAGDTATGKTYLTLQFGQSAYLAGYNVLAICTEMPEHQIARRDLAMRAGVNANTIKMGQVSEFGKDNINEIIDAPVIVDGEIVDNYYKILPGGIYGKFEDIIAAARELKPDILIVDGASLIKSTKGTANRWESMIETVEAFKHFAMKEQARVMLTYHFGKTNKGTTSGIYGGLAMSQFASIMLSFEFEREEDRNNSSPVQFRILNLVKGRDGENGKIRVLFDMKRSKIEQDGVLEGLEHDELNDVPDNIPDDEIYAEI